MNPDYGEYSVIGILFFFSHLFHHNITVIFTVALLTKFLSFLSTNLAYCISNQLDNNRCSQRRVMIQP